MVSVGQVCTSTWFCKEGLTVTIWHFTESLQTCGQVPGGVPVPRPEPDTESTRQMFLKTWASRGKESIFLPQVGDSWGGRAQVPLISSYIALRS